MTRRFDPAPVLLANGPHPVHERMIAHVGGDVVQCDQGGAISRLRAGAGRSFDGRPVVVEGGVPLLEAGVASLLADPGPVVELAADATHHDLQRPLPFRGRAGRLAHRFGERFVDATVAVSDVLAVLAGADGRPVRVAHPFVVDERRSALTDLPIDPSGTDVLCVGKVRPKNGQDLLVDAVEHLDADAHVHFAGEGTEALDDGDRVTGHGYVSEDALVDLFDDAALVAFPARVGAFPVVVLEALAAGVPVVTTPRVGNAGLVRALDGGLLAEPTPQGVAAAVDHYFGLSTVRRASLAELARHIGGHFDETGRLDAFADALAGVLRSVGYQFEEHT